MSAAPVLEVFGSIQGEGLHVGRPQVFLRLRGCPLRCSWCDTPGSWRLATTDRARIAAQGGTRTEEAWCDAERAARWVDEVDPRGDLAVSLTGGEPLMWPAFLLALRPLLGARRLHLETAGAHPATLGRVLGACDHVSLDLKLPADLGAPEELSPLELPPGASLTDEPAPRDAAGWRAARRGFLTRVAGRDACAKLVVAGGRAAAEYAELLADLAELAPRVPLVVQPASPLGGVSAPRRELVLELVERARDLRLDVRLVPQIHRLLRLP